MYTPQVSKRKSETDGFPKGIYYSGEPFYRFHVKLWDCYDFLTNLPSFTMKINHFNVGKYTVRPMDGTMLRIRKVETQPQKQRGVNV